MNGEVFDRPPSDVRQTMTVIYYELYKYVRSARMVGIFALAALIVAIILIIPPALGQEYPRDPAYFAQRFFLWTGVLIVVGATLFAGDSLASEFQGRTGYLMFPNPVKRLVYFTGKLLASLLTMFFVVSVFYVVVSLLTIWHSQSFSDLTYRSFGLALLYVVAAVGVGYLVSAVMKGATGALVFTFAILFLIFPILDGVLSFAGAKPGVLGDLRGAGHLLHHADPLPHRPAAHPAHGGSVRRGRERGPDLELLPGRRHRRPGHGHLRRRHHPRSVGHLPAEGDGGLTALSDSLTAVAECHELLSASKLALERLPGHPQRFSPVRR